MASVKKKTVKKKPLAKKPATKKPAAKKIAAQKPARKTTAKPAKKIAAKRTLAKKPTAKKIKTVTKKAPKKAPLKIAHTGPYGIPEQLRDAALKVLDDRQAEDIVHVALQGRSSVADYMIIASGRAARQVAAIADYLREAFYKAGAKFVRVEGKNEGNWVLVDSGDVIVHLFRPEVRAYYDLDTIWNGNRPPK